MKNRFNKTNSIKKSNVNKNSKKIKTSKTCSGCSRIKNKGIK